MEKRGGGGGHPKSLQDIHSENPDTKLPKHPKLKAGGVVGESLGTCTFCQKSPCTWTCRRYTNHRGYTHTHTHTLKQTNKHTHTHTQTFKNILLVVNANRCLLEKSSEHIVYRVWEYRVMGVYIPTALCSHSSIFPQLYIPTLCGNIELWEHRAVGI